MKTQCISATSCSALLDHVALVGTETAVMAWAPLLAGVRRHAGVAGAEGLRVLIVFRTPVTQEESRLDASAADLHMRSVWVLHLRRGEVCALVQQLIASAITKYWGIFNI